MVSFFFLTPLPKSNGGIYFTSSLHPHTWWGRAGRVIKWPEWTVGGRGKMTGPSTHCMSEPSEGTDQMLDCEMLPVKTHKVIKTVKIPHVWAKFCLAVSALLFYAPSPEHNQAKARAGGHTTPQETGRGQGHPNVCLVELLFHHCLPCYQLWHVPMQPSPLHSTGIC